MKTINSKALSKKQINEILINSNKNKRKQKRRRSLFSLKILNKSTFKDLNKECRNCIINAECDDDNDDDFLVANSKASMISLKMLKLDSNIFKKHADQIM